MDYMFAGSNLRQSELSCTLKFWSSEDLCSGLALGEGNTPNDATPTTGCWLRHEHQTLVSCPPVSRTRPQPLFCWVTIPCEGLALPSTACLWSHLDNLECEASSDISPGSQTSKSVEPFPYRDLIPNNGISTNMCHHTRDKWSQRSSSWTKNSYGL